MKAKWIWLLLPVIGVLLINSTVSYFNDPQIRFGWSFTDTDSLKLRDGGVQTHLRDTTLYSDFIPNDQSEEGIWNVAVYLDSASGASASIQLAVRLGDLYKKGSGGGMFGGGRDSTFIKWGPWKTVFAAMKIDTLYKKTIDPADSSWFMPSSGVQFRLTEADADTCKPHVKQYKR